MIEFNLPQTIALLASFGGDKDSTVAVHRGDEKWHSGPGLYVTWEGCEDEGSSFLGDSTVPEDFKEALSYVILSEAASDVVLERERQIQVEDWIPSHDDGHVQGELGAMAAFYAMPEGARN